MARRRRGIHSWVLLLAIAAAPAAAQTTAEPPPTGGTPLAATESTDPVLSLALPAPETRLRLFSENDPRLGATLPGLELPGLDAASVPAGAPRPRGLLLPSPLEGTRVLVWDPAAEGKLRLQLLHLERRTWDDLTPWEKVGFVTAQASAVAGMGYLLSRLF